VIDWIERLPDSISGIGLAALAWFGFNYAVLGERAMQRSDASAATATCVNTLSGPEENYARPRMPAIGAEMGLPELDGFLNKFVDAATPAFLTAAQKTAMCQCAVSQTTGALRFDYALHTASFRIFSPASIANVRSDSLRTVLSGVFGAIPGQEG
jgi:hypothetical protein